MKMEKILFILLVIFTFSRLIFLDADPGIFKAIGEIGDEGYWAYEARNKALFGEWITDDLTQSIATSPIYALISFIIFKLLGVHLFTARLVCALAGISSIFLLYFIVRKYDRKLAVITALILAINNSFFTYNRIGLPESLVIFFLLLNFLFLTYRSRSNFCYLFAGVCFMLAILSKITTIYFSIAIFLYLLALYLRKEINFKGIFTYLAGVLLIAVPIIIFYYIPLLSTFEATLKGLSGNASLTSVFSHIFTFQLSSYFALPSVFLLSILSLIYFKERKILIFFANIRQNIKLLDEIELIALSWFLGYSIGLLFSDFAERRFTLLIIPLVLFSSMLFDKRRKDDFTGEKYISPVSIVILLLPFSDILNRIISVLTNHKPALERILPSAISSIVYNMVEKFILNGLFILIAISLIILYVTIFRHKSRYKNTVDKYLPKISLISLFFSLLLNFIFNNGRIVEFIYDIHISKIFIVIITVLLTILSFIGIRKYTESLKRLTSSIYVIFCVIIIIFTLLFPSFSIKNSSMEMSKICNKGEWIIGALGHELSFENELRPLWWFPNIKSYEHMNKNAMEKYKPKYYLKIAYWEGREVYSSDFFDFLPRLERIGKPLVYLHNIELYPILGKPRVVLELYKINY